MMVTVCVAALLVAGLTLVSGFGLGSLLMPVFALFFPLPLAVAATAVVHLLNNVFKAGLLFREVDRAVLLRFGVPAIVAALPGALLLLQLSGLAPWWVWQWGERVCAAVVPAAGAAVTGEELRAFAKERLAPYKVPKDFLVLDALPRNAMGKVTKPAVKELFGD